MALARSNNGVLRGLADLRRQTLGRALLLIKKGIVLPVRSIRLGAASRTDIRRLLPRVPRAIHSFKRVLREIHLSYIYHTDCRGSVVREVVLDRNLQSSIVSVVVQERPIGVREFSNVRVFAGLHMMRRRPVISRVVVATLIR